MQRIQSTGGPIILLSETELGHWGGTAQSKQSPERFSVPSDYDRACSIDDYAGLLRVGAGDALILGDEPMQTAWFKRRKSEGGLLVRWRWANDEATILRHLHAMDDSIFDGPDLTLQVSHGRWLLFDSSIAGEDLNPAEAICIELGASRYNVSTAEFTPDDEMSLLLHRLLPADQAS